MNRAPHKYNATAIGYDIDGKRTSIEAVRFEGGLVVRAAGLWSHLNGLPEYHDNWRRSKPSFLARIEVVNVDPMAAYRHVMTGSPMPSGAVLAVF